MRIVCSLLLASSLFAQTPETMTKLVVRLSGPGIRANSDPALPRTIYVAPPHFARIEDPPDARLGIQKLTIIAEPDAYSVNVIDKKGTHAIDNGGPGDLHVPIVLPFDLKHRGGIIDQLEFGSELDFFEHAGAQRIAGPIINSKPTGSYLLENGMAKATLVLNPGTQRPVKLIWNFGDGEYTYEYISVEDAPFNPALFQKPAGIHWKEMPPDDNSEHG